jgi:hypothetical protein
MALEDLDMYSVLVLFQSDGFGAETGYLPRRGEANRRFHAL